MKKVLFPKFFLIAILLFGSGCTVKVEPVLSTSLGMEAFESMKRINSRDVTLALHIDKKIRELEVNQSIRQGEFSFPMGKAFSAKLIKALSYNFRSIRLIETSQYKGQDPVDAVMTVTLQDVDVNLGVDIGFSTVSTDAYTRLSVRAEIRDFNENKPIWVGTSQAKQDRKHEEYAQMTYQEAGRGYAVAIDTAIDKAIGDLISQMTKSQNLKTYISKWEA